MEWKRILSGAGLAGILAFSSGCESQRHEAEHATGTAVKGNPCGGPNAPETGMTGTADALKTFARYLPPLRRSAQTFEASPDLQLALQQTSLPIIFSVVRNEDGQTTVRALVTETVYGPKKRLLEKLEFQPEPAAKGAAQDLWQRRVTPADRNAFERLVLEQLQKIAVEIAELELKWHWSHTVGSLTQIDGKNSSHQIYSGHPLDVAMADCKGLEFVVARNGDETVYLRGGRFYVGDDHILRVGHFTMAGTLQKVPENALQVLIDSTGKVSASCADGSSVNLGALQVVRMNSYYAHEKDAGLLPKGNEVPVPVESGEVLRPGHYELGGSQGSLLHVASQLAKDRAALEQLLLALNQSGKNGTPSSVTPSTGGTVVRSGPLVIHAETPWALEHLKALGIALEHTPSKTIISVDTDPEALNIALTKVLSVLRVRMGIHEQNLRNAERLRDAENRLNPYRRKTLKLGPQGEPIEGQDPAPFPKNYKPGDPNADADGFVLMPNVNKAVESAEFQSAIEEYKMIRTVLERIAPNQFFPDPPTLP